MSEFVYVLTNQAPDYSAPPGAPLSVHKTLEGAKEHSGGRSTEGWREASHGRWYGPGGFGSIIRFEVLE